MCCIAAFLSFILYYKLVTKKTNAIYEALTGYFGLFFIACSLELW